MSEAALRRQKGLNIRAKLPQYFRVAAICVLGATIIAVIVGFYRERSKVPFRLKSEHTQLSTDVTAEVNGYQRLESEGEIKKYFIKADKATTFADNHQEMENVYLEVYDDTGTKTDKINADRALYIPEENKNFTGYFAGNVNIETRDALNVRTEHITYTKRDETAVADELVEFSRDNVKGKAFGAVVQVREKRLELLKDVEIETFESPELASSGVRYAKINSGNAALDQNAERIDFGDGVTINITSANAATKAPRNTDVNAVRAAAFFVSRFEGNPQLTKLELIDNVTIVTAENSSKPTRLAAGYALYDKLADLFDLKNGVHIITVDDDRPTHIRSSEAIYEQLNGKVFLFGGAEITQLDDLIKGDNITAELYANRKLKRAAVKGNALLRQIAPERTTEVTAPELNAAFNEQEQLVSAKSVGNSLAVLVPTNTTEYSKVALSAPRAIDLFFRGEGLLEAMQTDGRTTIRLDVADNRPDAANKRLTADSVRTFFGESGKDLTKAEAIGNAELFVEPLQASATNYRTTVNAPRFDCDFYPTGNNARTCVGATSTKTVRVPTLQSGPRGTQTITADRIHAQFSQQNRDVERMEATGNAKYNELDRNAVAGNIEFTAADEVVRLRGGEPTVWDSRARAKAPEIDWDTRNDRSQLRGGVSTTYYSQKQSGGATPFSDPGKPVFITASNADFDHRQETAVYSGNARGWQENNYVRAELLTIHQKQGTLHAEGTVQSLLYDMKRKENGRESRVPVYASANRMSYNRDTRLLRYEENVDIRQGPDRITAGVANVFLTEKNEIAQTIAENNVVITQPNRKALGEYAQYTAADESVILRGNPARVDDAENGSSQGGEVIVHLRENRVVGEGRSKENSTRRIRSVYKVKNN